ncbi:MAG: hypothetical protein PVJ52_00845 [Candidatus Woesebacteria bacterium]|jgi:hypothetical protein
MNRRDIVIGVIVLVALALMVYFWQSRTPEELEIPQPSSVEEQIEQSFNVDIPEDVEKIELTDTAGMDASAIATRDVEEGYSLTILADLPDVQEGEFYQAWIENEEKTIPVGRLTVAKGGYILEFESSIDYSEYDSVMVTLEETPDQTPEETILQGDFE